ncbi:hypothetical protein H6F96_20905 [Microcoleus sp. FACHB-53]|nr:hypothetical protein [Microcoleus sp. FACHB-53]
MTLILNAIASSPHAKTRSQLHLILNAIAASPHAKRDRSFTSCQTRSHFS